MAGKNTAVFGTYETQIGVESGVEALQAAGFRYTDVSVLFSDNQGTKAFAHEKGTKAPEGNYRRLHRRDVGWRSRLARRHRCACYPRAWSFHRRRSNHGGPCRRRRGRSHRWHHRCVDRHGNSGVRGEALRRPRQRWRHPSISAFGRLRVDFESKEDSGSHGRPGCLFDG
jgi:hypothetical protein